MGTAKKKKASVYSQKRKIKKKNEKRKATVGRPAHGGVFFFVVRLMLCTITLGSVTSYGLVLSELESGVTHY